MINKFWYEVNDRGLDTVAVWSQCALSFVVGELTLAVHSADVNLLAAHILQCAQAEQDLDTARDARDAAAAGLRALYVRACRVISGCLTNECGMADKVQAVYNVRGSSFRAVQNKGVKLVAAWQAVNAHRATLSPAQPPLMTGTVTVDELQSMLGNYAQLLVNVASKEVPLNTKTAQLRGTAGRVDRNNKRWYKAWQGQFVSGSPERAALAQINTGPSQPLPGQAVFLTVETLPGLIVKLAFGAARATSFTLLHKGPGAGVFTVLADNLTVKTFEHPAQTVGGHNYKVIGRNSNGAGAESAPLEVVVSQQAVA